MKKWLFFWMLTQLAQITRATLIEVCPDCNYCTPGEGILSAEAGDTVLIRQSHYYETNILIDKPLTVIGENYPVIDGQMLDHIITVTADSVVLQGLQIQNVGTSFIEDRAAIRVEKAKYFQILDNKIFHTFFAIYLAHARHGIVRSNTVIGQAVDEMTSANAIHAWYCQHLEVSYNEVARHRDGIYFEFVDHSRIFENNSHHNIRYGLHFMFSNNDEYYDNTFRNNGAGVAVMFSKTIQMRNNLFIDNWGRSAYGLLLKEINDADIVHNIFQRNTLAIFVEGSNRITYKENDFIRNGWAVKMHGGATQNHFSHNNFFQNTFDLTTETNGIDNSYNDNYWSEYTGYDLDRDGRGDVPFRPIKLFSYIVNQTPEAIVLLRSPFVGLLNFSEKASPIFTPTNILDESPFMKPIPWNQSPTHDSH